MAPFLGVWRRIGLRPSSATHLVIEPEQLWVVRPDHVYTVGDPGPERRYTIRGSGPIWEIDIQHSDHVAEGLLGFDGERLRLTLGYHARPASLDDVLRGTCDVYVRETEEAVCARLAAPVPRAAQVVREHPMLGELTFEPNLEWWSGRVAAGMFPKLGDASFEVSIALPFEASDDELSAAAATLATIELAPVLAKASAELLGIYNAGWRSWEADGEQHDGPVLDRARFEARLTLKEVTLTEEGGVDLWFDDGDLFWGHSVLVELDEALVPAFASMEG